MLSILFVYLLRLSYIIMVNHFFITCYSSTKLTYMFNLSHIHVYVYMYTYTYTHTTLKPNPLMPTNIKCACIGEVVTKLSPIGFILHSLILVFLFHLIIHLSSILSPSLIATLSHFSTSTKIRTLILTTTT
jgi:hypothetical protein